MGININISGTKPGWGKTAMESGQVGSCMKKAREKAREKILVKNRAESPATKSIQGLRTGIPFLSR